jgi:hypothetical protein
VDPWSIYRDVDEFLTDMREGTLKEGFTLSQLAWDGLMEKVNADSVFADEIVANGVLLLMATHSKSEIDGLMSLAEVCYGQEGQVDA